MCTLAVTPRNRCVCCFMRQMWICRLVMYVPAYGSAIAADGEPVFWVTKCQHGVL